MFLLFVLEIHFLGFWHVSIIFCLFLKLFDVGVTLIYIKIDTKAIYSFMVNLNGKLKICPVFEHKMQIELSIFFILL